MIDRMGLPNAGVTLVKEAPVNLQEAAAAINSHLAQGDLSRRDSLQHYHQAGQWLLKVKGSMPHGKFGHWCKVNLFRLKARTAGRYMRLAKLATVAKLGDEDTTIEQLEEIWLKVTGRADEKTPQTPEDAQEGPTEPGEPSKGPGAVEASEASASPVEPLKPFPSPREKDPKRIKPDEGWEPFVLSLRQDCTFRLIPKGKSEPVAILAFEVTEREIKVRVDPVEEEEPDVEDDLQEIVG